MIANIRSAGFVGMNGEAVNVQVVPQSELGLVRLEGLPPSAAEAMKERVLDALMALEIVPKTGLRVAIHPSLTIAGAVALDLAVAIGIRVAQGDLVVEADVAFVSGVSPTGTAQPVPGIVELALALRQAGVKHLYVSVSQVHEVETVEGLVVHGVSDLATVIAEVQTGGARLPLQIRRADANPIELPHDLENIDGQETVKRVLEIAAAGAHHVLMVSPDPSLTYRLAQVLLSLLPPLTQAELEDEAALYSMAGLPLPERDGQPTRPLRSPTSQISQMALVGRWDPPLPGELSLAHRGILYLDDLVEYQPRALASIREGLVEGCITLGCERSPRSAPSRFMLVTRLGPCPCGWLHGGKGWCTCSHRMRQAYLRRVDQSITDELDLYAQLTPEMALRDGFGQQSKSLESVRARVIAARARQRERTASAVTRVSEPSRRGLSRRRRLAEDNLWNANLDPAGVRASCRLDSSAREVGYRAITEWRLKAHSWHRILRVARTIADLEAEDMISGVHLAEALQYRLRLPSV